MLTREFFLAYGVVIPINIGLYLQEYFENNSYKCETWFKNNEFKECVGFASDSYCENYGEMCIFLKSSQNILFDRKTGGNGDAVLDLSIHIDEVEA